jgi:hypothetical protein
MRAFKFIAIGCIVGLLIELLLGMVFPMGAEVAGPAISQLIFALIGGGIVGSVAHFLTRPKVKRKKLVPKNDKATAADLSRHVQICTFIGGVLGFTAMMVGNIVYRVVPGGAVGGLIGGGVGSSIGRLVGIALFPNQRQPPDAA